MAVAHIYTVAFEGIEAREVDVQVHIGRAPAPATSSTSSDWPTRPLANPRSACAPP